MAANQNITQLTPQAGSANTTSLFYAVTSGTTDTSLPFSVFVNNLGLTGVPTVPTASTGTNTTQIASTAFVQAQLTSTLASYATNAGATLTSVTISSGTINGTSVGATTPSTGAFTTLSASSSVSGTGFTNLLSSPTAIGNTAPNTGSFTTLSSSGLISPNSTAGVKGTATNDSAQAGSIGEYTSNSATGTSATTGTPLNATSVSLTAGDWDVTGVVSFNPASTTTLAAIFAGISTTSATFGALGTYVSLKATFTAGPTNDQLNTPTVRISLASTTTVYLVAQSTFGTSTLTVDGFIRARRVR